MIFESSKSLFFTRVKSLLRNKGGALEGIELYRLSKDAIEKGVESIIGINKLIIIIVTIVLEIFTF